MVSQWLSSKESACNAGDPGSIPGLGSSPGERHGNPLQYSCLENSMARGGLQSIGLQRAATTQQLSMCTHLHTQGYSHRLKASPTKYLLITKGMRVRSWGGRGSPADKI